MAARATKMAPRGTKKTHKCIIRCKSASAGAKMKPPGPLQCPKETTPFKTQAKRLPRPGARRRRRRSGRGLEGRAHQAVGRNPSTKLISQSVCIKLIQGGAASAAGLFQLPPATNIYQHLPHFLDQKIVKKTRGTHGRPKGENKRPEPQSDRAGAVQTLFATFHTNSKYHRKCLHSWSHFLLILVPFS